MCVCYEYMQEDCKTNLIRLKTTIRLAYQLARPLAGVMFYPFPTAACIQLASSTCQAAMKGKFAKYDLQFADWTVSLILRDAPSLQRAG